MTNVENFLLYTYLILLENKNMKEPSVTTLKKYLNVMSKMKAKYITSEKLSYKVGVYPDVINEAFSYFDPMVNFDSSYDLLELVDKVEAYIKEKETNKVVVHRVTVKKKEVDQYTNTVDYIYKNLAVGGFVDKNKVLSEGELKILQKLIKNDLNRLQGKKKR